MEGLKTFLVEEEKLIGKIRSKQGRRTRKDNVTPSEKSKIWPINRIFEFSADKVLLV